MGMPCIFVVHPVTFVHAYIHNIERNIGGKDGWENIELSGIWVTFTGSIGDSL